MSEEMEKNPAHGAGAKAPKAPAVDGKKAKSPELLERERKEELKENVIAIAIVLVVSIGVAFWVYRSMTAVPVIDEGPRAQIPAGTAPALGDENATMTVVIFSDFECGFCGQFARDEHPRIKAEHVDTGQARIVFKHFPLPSHSRARKAADAAACAAEQGKFWEYHDVLFHNQDALDPQDLQRYADVLGMDSAGFARCLAQSNVVVEADLRLGEQLGVSGTPTFFFNGRRVVGMLSAEEFARELARDEQT